MRQYLELAEANKLDEADKQRLLQRTKAHGYQLKIRSEGSIVPSERAPNGDRPTLNQALDANEIPEKLSQKIRLASTPPPPLAAAKKKPAEGTADETVNIKALGPTQMQLGLGAFGYALLFVLAGTGAGYAAAHGASELLENGGKLPGLGTHEEYVFPLVLFVFGLLPAGVGYKWSAWFKGALAGAALGGVGWVAWGTGQAAIHASRVYQAISFGLVGFLAALLILGLTGGTKKQPPRVKKKPA